MPRGSASQAGGRSHQRHGGRPAPVTPFRGGRRPRREPRRATGRDPRRRPAAGRAGRARARGRGRRRCRGDARRAEGRLARVGPRRPAPPGAPGDGAARPRPPRPPPARPGDPLAEVLARLGVRRLRPGQDRAIAAGLAGQDALVVMATGSGKSLCYQAPAAALSGLTVVVSPLIALMADQLGGLRRAGIAAAALNSDMPDDAAARRARAGPRRRPGAALRGARALPLATRSCGRWTRRASPCWWSTRPTACPSGATSSAPTTGGWAASASALRPRATMALTATATAQVRADIARRLGLRDPVETVGGFDRPNLTFDAVWVEGKGSVARKRGDAAGGRARRPTAARRSSTAAPGRRPRRRRAFAQRRRPPGRRLPRRPQRPRRGPGRLHLRARAGGGRHERLRHGRERPGRAPGGPHRPAGLARAALPGGRPGRAATARPRAT